jgi:hypothetical protein
MFRVNTRAAVGLMAVALVASAAACAKKEAPPAADTTAMAPAPAPAPAALHVTGVETGKGINADKTVKDDAHDFGVRDTVYVSVKTEGAGSGKLSAKVTFSDGQTVKEDSQDIAPTGDANHEFHLMKATPWPKGDYKVEIMLDGVAAGSKDFTIK